MVIQCLASAITRNFSALLDGLLTDWLKEKPLANTRGCILNSETNGPLGIEPRFPRCEVAAIYL